MKDFRYPVPEDVSLLPVYRELARCTQHAGRLMSGLLEPYGLTPSQFDVLATLGDTPGLSFKMLSMRSLVTGGTLTPILNRLEARGLVARCKHVTDSRQVIVKLTPEGQALYEATFLPTIDQAQCRINTLTPAEQAQLVTLLHKLAQGLEQPRLEPERSPT